MKLADDGTSLTVDTSESAFLGKTVTVTVALTEYDSQRVRSAKHLEVEIAFVDESSQTTGDSGADNETNETSNDAVDQDTSTKPILFDMSKFSATRITCSEKDADWILKLPPLLDLSEEEDDV